MKIIDNTKNYYSKSIVLVFLIFIIPIFISYFYSIFYGYYNGDFMGYKVGLSNFQLLGCLILSLLPFVYVYFVYAKRKKENIKKTIFVNIKYFAFFSYFVEVVRLIIYYLFSNGVLSSMWIVTLLESVNPYPIIFVYFLISNSRTKYILLLFMILESYFRASFNGIYYVGVILIFNFSSILFKNLYKKIFVLIVLFSLLPTIVFNLYMWRSDLRGMEGPKYYGNELLYGVFAGRFSSFPNLAYLMEDNVFTSSVASSLPNTFYPLRVFSIYGISLGSLGDVPEKSLYLATQNNNKNTIHNSTSFMLGTSGILYLSYVKSFWALILNIIFIVGIVKMSFFMTRKIGFHFINELVAAFLLLSILSGVSVELFRVFLSLLFLRFVYAMSRFNIVAVKTMK